MALLPPLHNAQMWIMLPSAAYTMIWMTGLSVVALVVVGIKLQVPVLPRAVLSKHGTDGMMSLMA